MTDRPFAEIEHEVMSRMTPSQEYIICGKSTDFYDSEEILRYEYIEIGGTFLILYLENKSRRAKVFLDKNEAWSYLEILASERD